MYSNEPQGLNSNIDRYYTLDLFITFFHRIISTILVISDNKMAASSGIKPKKPRINWSQEEWHVLEEIVNKTRTESCVPMVKLLENQTPKNNQKLCV